MTGSQALGYGSRVLRLVMAHMPALERVICLGQEAWECTCLATAQEGNWADYRDGRQNLGFLSAAYHPATRIATEVMKRPFEAIAKDLLVASPKDRPR